MDNYRYSRFTANIACTAPSYDTNYKKNRVLLLSIITIELEIVAFCPPQKPITRAANYPRKRFIHRLDRGRGGRGPPRFPRIYGFPEGIDARRASFHAIFIACRN